MGRTIILYIINLICALNPNRIHKILDEINEITPNLSNKH